MGHELRTQPLRGHHRLRRNTTRKKVVFAEGIVFAAGVVYEVCVPLFLI